MKPIEVGFDGSFKAIGNFANVILKPAKAQLKDWPTEHLCNTMIWSCIDQENPKLLYVSKDGKLYAMNFEAFEE